MLYDITIMHLKNRVLFESMSSPFFLLLPRTPLHAAAFADNIHGLQLLLQHQAEVDGTDQLGRTPLMMAAENGQTAAVGKWCISCIYAFLFFVFPHPSCHIGLRESIKIGMYL